MSDNQDEVVEALHVAAKQSNADQREMLKLIDEIDSGERTFKPLADNTREEIKLVLLFHDTYERLAPKYGYETRDETKVFDAKSKNGRLMLAVIREINRTYIQSEITKAEKSYGGCHNCYGKGYATVNDRWMGRDTDWDIGSNGGVVSGGDANAMVFCSCDRGTQLNKQINKSREQLLDELDQKAMNVEKHHLETGAIEHFGAVPLLFIEAKRKEIKEGKK